MHNGVVSQRATPTSRRLSSAAAAEALLAALAGAALAFVVAAPLGPVVALPATVVAGTNGALSGARGTYRWSSGRGLFAFVLDSTWGLVGTALGLALHAANLAGASSRYRPDLSARRDRHVYEGGVRLKRAFALTLGNVISNAGCDGREINELFIDRHEDLHVWQARLFGPVFQLTYAAWGALGALAAVAVWLARRDESLWSLVETACYYDNPFEYWAYRNDGNWPPRLANRHLAWRGPRGGTRDET